MFVCLCVCLLHPIALCAESCSATSHRPRELCCCQHVCMFVCVCLCVSCGQCWCRYVLRRYAGGRMVHRALLSWCVCFVCWRCQPTTCTLMMSTQPLTDWRVTPAVTATNKQTLFDANSPLCSRLPSMFPATPYLSAMSQACGWLWCRDKKTAMLCMAAHGMWTHMTRWGRHTQPRGVC